MNSPASPDSEPLPLIESDPEAAYTLDVVARSCGLSSQTVLHYHEQGLITPGAQTNAGDCLYDEETLLRLRRIEQLRSAYGMELGALKLTLDLMDEVERLRAELRSRR
jgi:DNA-binding transcriptional MerR regulator